MEYLVSSSVCPPLASRQWVGIVWRRGGVTRRVALVCVAAVVLWMLFGLTPRQADASPGGQVFGGGGLDFTGEILRYIVAPALELAIPDTYLELGEGVEGEAGVSLAWPLTVPFASFGSWDTTKLILEASPEVHYVPRRDIVRGVFMGRVRSMWMFAGVYVEGGYAIGEDANAPVVGAAPLFSYEEQPLVAITYRATITGDVRHAVTLNVEFPGIWYKLLGLESSLP